MHATSEVVTLCAQKGGDIGVRFRVRVVSFFVSASAGVSPTARKRHACYAEWAAFGHQHRRPLVFNVSSFSNWHHRSRCVDVVNETNAAVVSPARVAFDFEVFGVIGYCFRFARCVECLGRPLDSGLPSWK